MSKILHSPDKQVGKYAKFECPKAILDSVLSPISYKKWEGMFIRERAFIRINTVEQKSHTPIYTK